MGYRLGVDLGTTFTSAAVYTSGWPSMVGLGNRAMQIPSVLFLKPDGEYLVGEAAERRGATQPDRVVREFKRRLGDQVPILVGGAPQSPQALQARLLEWVVARVSERQGSPPDAITLTYPANWGPYKQDLFGQTIRMAELPAATTCTEPEAAATLYAARNVLAEGDCIAVYDLGGGTFDAAVLRKAAAGFTLLGHPEGIEQLGGIDFDEAVFQHVLDGLRDRLPATLDDDALTNALARLRRDCVEAKEALSSDTETVIAVSLPGLTTSVRLVRTEFEDMIRPSIADTIAAMRRVLRSAGVDAADLTAIVLTGGSSRIPLVSEQLGQVFDVPLALDTHPKHDVALGAAIHGAAVPTAAQPPPVSRATRPPTDVPPSGTASGGPTAPAAPPAEPLARAGTDRKAPPGDGTRRRRLLVGSAAGAALLLAAGVIAIVVLTSGSGDNEGDTATPLTSSGPTTSSGTSAPPTATTWPATTLLVSGQVGTASTVYSIDLTAHPPTAVPLLTSTADGPPHQPTFAPDRKTIVYLHGLNGEPGFPILRTFDGQERRLITEGPCGTMYRPSYSADGSKIAAVCPLAQGGATFGLFVIDVASGRVTGPLDTGAQPVGDTSWRGDDEIIFLQRQTEGGDKTVYAIASSGDPASVRQLSTQPASRPDWCEGQGTLIIENKSGSKQPGPVGVLSDDGELTTLSLGDDIMSATWSPDCKNIAITRPDASTAGPSLFIVRADGTGTPTEIALPGNAKANQPAWGAR